ncbi:nicotinate phosphoribosyltransferase [Balneicella halophila]|uniref:Nicotinate phosphoribosyltransferase n=1 Tax=Balneicella halophila TaxID=1537566 RepID=A0A7L4UNG4_BALHA|nr:nicotinate phosphoribosyltransferase [Balneicella halophila]PVX50082.1 nicotinate phosphoribosyltransferase [Balneicella halophila]
MHTLTDHIGLYTDFYELTMAQSYFFTERIDDVATFDYFFRSTPFDSGYVVYAGLEELLSLITKFSYSQEDIDYLRKQGMKEEFLNYLKDFRFSGNIYSVKEGEIVFPNEPLLTVEANLIEAQLIESLILNYLNFQSLIATKARRIRDVAGERSFADFGLRRAQTLGSIHAARAAVIGGADSTSNTYAGMMYDIPVSGTQAHSWVQSFDDEIEAFRKYAEINPDNTVLLVDTYDTLKSGVPNAIKVAKEMEKQGHRLKAVRLDSGDLAYLSRKVRKMLNKAGLDYVGIVASNQLNERIIKSLIKEQGAKLDGFGVGTELATGQEDGALGGVYKLVESDGKPRLKISENVEKISLPCNKKLVRYFDEEGKFYRDGVLLRDQNPELTIFHPFHYHLNTDVSKLKYEILTEQVIKGGEICIGLRTLKEIKQYSLERFKQLSEEHKRFISPHTYKVGVAKDILDIRDKLIAEVEKDF